MKPAQRAGVWKAIRNQNGGPGPQPAMPVVIQPRVIIPRNESRKADIYGPGAESEEEEEEESIPEDADSQEAEPFSFVRDPGSWFTFLVAGAIVLNVVFMTFQVNYPHVMIPSGCDPCDFGCLNFWSIVNFVFLAFFSVELSLRFYVFGCCEFFCSKADWAWNLFDFTVVVLGILDLISKLFINEGSIPSKLAGCTGSSSGSGNSSKFVTIIRVVRILRILRIIRLFKQLHQLNVIVKGLVNSLPIVGWISLLLMLFIMILSIFFNTMIGHNAEMWGEEAETVRMYFGSVTACMQTLYQFLSLDDWSMITRLVMKQMAWLLPVFIFYVIIAAFVVLSVLTGMMAEHTKAVREEQEKEALQAEHDADLAHLGVFYEHFFNTDRYGRLDLEDFKRMVRTPDCNAEFHNMGFGSEFSENAEDVFSFMDKDNKGFVSWREFRSGLEELNEATGTCMPKQLSLLMVTIRHVQNNKGGGSAAKDTMARPQDFEDRLKDCGVSIENANDKLDKAEEVLEDFRRVCGVKA